MTDRPLTAAEQAEVERIMNFVQMFTIEAYQDGANNAAESSSTRRAEAATIAAITALVRRLGDAEAALKLLGIEPPENEGEDWSVAWEHGPSPEGDVVECARAVAADMTRTDSRLYRAEAERDEARRLAEEGRTAVVAVAAGRPATWTMTFPWEETP